LPGVARTFDAILTPEFNDFDGMVMYVKYFMHQTLTPALSFWIIIIDGMRPRNLSILYCLVFLALISLTVGIICWLTGGNYIY